MSHPVEELADKMPPCYNLSVDKLTGRLERIVSASILALTVVALINHFHPVIEFSNYVQKFLAEYPFTLVLLTILSAVVGLRAFSGITRRKTLSRKSAMFVYAIGYMFLASLLVVSQGPMGFSWVLSVALASVCSVSYLLERWARDNSGVV